MLKEKILKEIKSFWNDEEAQGMMEYILMAVAVVGIAIVVGPKIKEIVLGETDKLGTSLEGFNADL